jgi:peptidoglycan/xylan/chitin deacetylase (PgdA/CDA1 family)
MTATEPFWPDNARLAVSFSLMFEAGGQPISGAGGVIPDPIENNLPDLPTNAFFQYGVYEGIPRILDLMDKHQVKLGSFMIGRAVEKVPELAREIVNRGHEAAAHGCTWENSYFLNADAERRFIADSVEAIQKVTGLRPIGWNAYWMRNSPHTLDILQLLGFRTEHGRALYRQVEGRRPRHSPLHLPHERHRVISVPGLEPGRLRIVNSSLGRPGVVEEPGMHACSVHAESKKTQKFVFRSTLRPNQISFSHGQDPKRSFWPGLIA